MKIKDNKKVLELKIASFTLWMVGYTGFKPTDRQIECFTSLIGNEEIGSNYEQVSIYKKAVLMAVGL